eukprot:TRINITY_DN18700_c0_g1_i3.p1 TRINITY_DN18700_c0_g1~~TRINITY_DN18700_c0_g1_i3.p1  ORF type:complete len:498 (+),score=25.52 TRINITY_DN18700_c0_g1_i3:34-1527(+)
MSQARLLLLGKPLAAAMLQRRGSRRRRADPIRTVVEQHLGRRSRGTLLLVVRGMALLHFCNDSIPSSLAAANYRGHQLNLSPPSLAETCPKLKASDGSLCPFLSYSADVLDHELRRETCGRVAAEIECLGEACYSYMVGSRLYRQPGVATIVDAVMQFCTELDLWIPPKQFFMTYAWKATLSQSVYAKLSSDHLYRRMLCIESATVRHFIKEVQVARRVRLSRDVRFDVDLPYGPFGWPGTPYNFSADCQRRHETRSCGEVGEGLTPYAHLFTEQVPFNRSTTDPQCDTDFLEWPGKLPLARVSKCCADWYAALSCWGYPCATQLVGRFLARPDNRLRNLMTLHHYVTSCKDMPPLPYFAIFATFHPSSEVVPLLELDWGAYWNKLVQDDQCNRWECHSSAYSEFWGTVQWVHAVAYDRRRMGLLASPPPPPRGGLLIADVQQRNDFVLAWTLPCAFGVWLLVACVCQQCVAHRSPSATDAYWYVGGLPGEVVGAEM